MVDATDPGIRRRTIMTLASVVDRELTRMAGRSADRRTREAEARCIVGAWLGVAAWWLESAPGMSPEAIDAIFQRMVCPALPRGSQSSGG
jgi:hypothetical protein